MYINYDSEVDFYQEVDEYRCPMRPQSLISVVLICFIAGLEVAPQLEIAPQEMKRLVLPTRDMSVKKHDAGDGHTAVRHLGVT